MYLTNLLCSPTKWSSLMGTFVGTRVANNLGGWKISFLRPGKAGLRGCGLQVTFWTCKHGREMHNSTPFQVCALTTSIFSTESGQIPPFLWFKRHWGAWAAQLVKCPTGFRLRSWSCGFVGLSPTLGCVVGSAETTWDSLSHPPSLPLPYLHGLCLSQNK